jgi:hypothetical protein
MVISTKEKLKRLEERKSKIKSEIQQAKAKISKEKRKLDTRKKILIGAMILRKVDSGDWPEDRLKNAMDEYLEKDSDRALFELKKRKA